MAHFSLLAAVASCLAGYDHPLPVPSDTKYTTLLSTQHCSSVYRYQVTILKYQKSAPKGVSAPPVMEEDWIPEAREAPHLPIINQIEREDWNGAKKAVQKKLQKSTDTIYPVSLPLFSSGARCDAALNSTTQAKCFGVADCV